MTSFQHASRPKLDVKGPCEHHGTVVHTDKGNSYLIHSTPASGVVATPASNMSKNWTKSPPVPVTNKATVQTAMNSAGGRTLNHTVNYLTSGTCIESSSRMEKHLTTNKTTPPPQTGTGGSSNLPSNPPSGNDSKGADQKKK